MEPTILADDGYPQPFPTPPDWSMFPSLLADDECCDEGWCWMSDLNGNEVALECEEHGGR